MIDAARKKMLHLPGHCYGPLNLQMNHTEENKKIALQFNKEVIEQGNRGIGYRSLNS